MQFDLSAWLHRRQIEARFSGAVGHVQALRVSNPHHAVGVKPCSRPCAAATALKGRRFLSAEAPRLPLSGCTGEVGCGCTYVHFDDRRSGIDRRKAQAGGPRLERRGSKGRRDSDY